MAIALDRRSAGTGRQGIPGWRIAGVAVALLTLAAGVVLSGGFSLPSPPAATEVGRLAPMAPQGPALDGRGKWTGYTR